MADNTFQNGAAGFNFPLDKFQKSYSGMGPEHRGLLTRLLPQTQQVFSQFPEKRDAYYSQARSDVNTGFDKAIGDVGKTYERTLQPALQRALNNLAGRGMMNSTVAGNTLANTATGIGEGIIDKQSSFDLARRMQLADLAKNQAANMYQYPQLLTSLLRQGQYSESSDAGQPYRTALSFLQSMMD